MGKSFSEYIQGDKLVLVDFFAEWCGPCKMMGPVLKELKSRMGDDVVILKIDVDKNPSASQAYRIQSVPTLMLFHNGQIVWRKSGVPSISELEKLVQNHRQPAKN
ncbi:MAG: thioredoxin [Saprospiraceae bacterium]|nr:thioredoxin [Saprospiraceae bacterium]